MYRTHRIRTMSTLITLEINIYFSRTVSFASCNAIYLTPYVFYSSLFFKPAYADRHDSEITRAVEIDHRHHIDTRKCNVSIDDVTMRLDVIERARARGCFIDIFPSPCDRYRPHIQANAIPPPRFMASRLLQITAERHSRRRVAIHSHVLRTYTS